MDSASEEPHDGQAEAEQEQPEKPPHRGMPPRRNAPVLIAVLCWGLEELADIELQRRLWTGRGRPGEMSSFEEAVSRVYDDSGLDVVLDRGDVAITEAIDQDLRQLGVLQSRLDAHRSPDAVIDDEQMVAVRDLASRVLKAVEVTQPSGRRFEQFKEEILLDAVFEDYQGLWEPLWWLRGGGAIDGQSESDRQAFAEHALRELFDGGLIYFFRAPRGGPPRGGAERPDLRFTAEEVDATIRSDWWRRSEGLPKAHPNVWLGPTEAGETAATKKRDVDGNTYEVVGGATIPGPTGVHSLGASYPLVVLEVSRDGVRVRLRWPWMAALVRWVMRRDGAARGAEAEWVATWNEIDRVLVGPKSIVMFRGPGYPCRFGPSPSRRQPRRSVISKLEDELAARGVEVTRVRSTVSYGLQMGRNR